MSFSDAPLKDVLMIFSQQSGLNFVASQEIETKKVTVSLENVTPADALEAIVNANGLAYTKKPVRQYFHGLSAEGRAVCARNQVFHLKMRGFPIPRSTSGECDHQRSFHACLLFFEHFHRHDRHDRHFRGFHRPGPGHR